jgi:hypothetical protein
MGKFIKDLFCTVLLFMAHEGFSNSSPTASPGYWLPEVSIV